MGVTTTTPYRHWHKHDVRLFGSPVPPIGIGKRGLAADDSGECLGQALVDTDGPSEMGRHPLPRVDCPCRTLAYAHPTVDALVWVYDKEAWGLMEADHRAHCDTVGVLAQNASFRDYVRHSD